MAKLAEKLTLITFLASLAWLCESSSPDESCDAGDSECQAASPRKSGDAMLQIQHNFAQEDSHEAREESDAAEYKTGKARTSTGKGRSDESDKDVGDLYAYYVYFGTKPQPKRLQSYSAKGDPSWSKLVKKDALAVPKPDWIWEVDGYAVDYDVPYTVDEKGKNVLADVAYPDCSGPEGGFPAMVIMPGRSNKKLRHKFWIIMFASHGVVGMSLDVAKSTKPIKDARNFLLETEEYKVDPSKLNIIGYSAGAGNILGTALSGGNAYKNYATWTIVAGISARNLKEYESKTNPILLIQAENDGMFASYDGFWDDITGWAAGQIAADGGRTKFLPYQDGGHQPSQQTNFFSEVLKFITDPVEYESPKDDGFFSFGTYVHSPVTEVHAGKGCYGNEEGIEPILTMNLWNGGTGSANCLGACKQVKGCKAFDFYGYTKVADKMNCVLYSQSCTTPGPYKGGSHWTFASYDGPFKPAYCNAA